MIVGDEVKLTHQLHRQCRISKSSNLALIACNVVAHGVDLVDIEDLRRLVETPLSSQLSRTFTQGELDSCGEGQLQLERLAGRFATKEAIMKALGVGFGDGVGPVLNFVCEA